MSFLKQIRELWDHLRGKGPAAAVALTLDLGEARDNKPYLLEAGAVYVETCNGDLYARINGPNGDGVNLRYVKKILYPVSSLYLTNTAQSGKSARLLLLPTGMDADPPDVGVPADDIVSKGCKVGLSANQSVASGVWTVINYTNILFDDFAEWDTVNFRFVPLLSGRYLITFAVCFMDMADGTDVEARFQQTTPTPEALIYGFNRPGGVNWMNIFGASVHELVAGRQYQQLAYQASGATKTLGGHYSYNYLTITRLFVGT